MDGNKRLGHAAMETFLVMNGYELVADVDDAEKAILTLAAGKLTREELLEWVSSSVEQLPTQNIRKVAARSPSLSVQRGSHW